MADPGDGSGDLGNKSGILGEGSAFWEVDPLLGGGSKPAPQKMVKRTPATLPFSNPNAARNQKVTVTSKPPVNNRHTPVLFGPDPDKDCPFLKFPT